MYLVQYLFDCFLISYKTLNSFIAPQRFVAVKPKELTIADYGYVLHENDNNKTKFDFLTGNAVFLFQLSGENLEFSEDVSTYTPCSGEITDSKTLEMIGCGF